MTVGKIICNSTQKRGMHDANENYILVMSKPTDGYPQRRKDDSSSNKLSCEPN